jgi:long-chain acyl-CoA synthetase
MNVADSLGRWAQETPFAVAILDDAQIFHYRDLDTAVWRTASRFVAEGIRPGDRIGISLAGNSALYLIVVYALARMGAVVMLLPVTEPPAVRQALARRFHLAAVVADDDAARLDGLPLLKPTMAWFGSDTAPVDVGVRFEGDALPCMILLSSGTTGAPKAMERSHEDYIRLFDIGHRQVGSAPGDRFLALIGFHFSLGLYHPMLTLAGGGTVRIPVQPISVPDLTDIIDRENITRLALTPALAGEMLPHFTDDKPRFPGIRRFSISTMFTPETLRREFRRRISPNLFVVYSTNEAWYLTRADAAAQVSFPETVGFPVEGVEIQIVDERDQTLPAGQVGLVRARTTALPVAYIDDPEATAKAFKDGWYYSGDLGLLSPEGALFLKGRADDMINYDGVKIFPADIETTLLQHPAVAEAAAFPVTIEGYRQIPVAAVVLRAMASSSENLIAFCQKHLGARSPRRIYIFSALPKNPMGKVLKRELAQQLSQSLSAAERRP